MSASHVTVALDPEGGETEVEETMSDAIEKLRVDLEHVKAERDALERRMDEIQAAISESEGDHLAAEWHRLKAQGRRDEAHVAWRRMMAEASIRYDCDPARWVSDDAAQRIAELRAEVTRLRNSPAPSVTMEGQP